MFIRSLTVLLRYHPTLPALRENRILRLLQVDGIYPFLDK